MIGFFKRIFENEADDTDAPTEQRQAVLSNFEDRGEGWFPVAPLGEHPHPSGAVQVLTNEDAQQIVAWANAQGAEWTGVPIHFDPPHPTDDAPARGWVKEFRVLENELQCKPIWGADGRRRILENAEYKRVTPSWNTRLIDNSWHPFEILHIGLTNRPAIKATRPWVNSEQPELIQQVLENGGPWWDEFVGKLQEMAGDADSADAARLVISEKLSQLWQQQRQLEQLMGLLANVRNSVGASDESSPEDIVTMVNSLADRASRSERALSDARSELETVDALVVDHFIHAGRIDPGKRDAAIQVMHNSREHALAVWGGSAKPAAKTPPADPLAGKVLQNAELGTPKAATDKDLRVINNAVQDLQREDGMTLDQANDEAWRRWQAGELKTDDKE